MVINLGAYTAEGANYPPFVSINMAGKYVEITVRNHPRDGMCGDTSTIRVAKATYLSLLDRLNTSRTEVK